MAGPTGDSRLKTNRGLSGQDDGGRADQLNIPSIADLEKTEPSAQSGHDDSLRSFSPRIHRRDERVFERFQFRVDLEVFPNDALVQGFEVTLKHPQLSDVRCRYEFGSHCSELAWSREFWQLLSYCDEPHLDERVATRYLERIFSRYAAPSPLEQFPSALALTSSVVVPSEDLVQTTAIFAPDLCEFFRGTNRQSVVLTRGTDFIAEFVMVDQANAVVSAYAYLRGAPAPLAICSPYRPLPTVKEFRFVVDEIVHRVTLGGFAPVEVLARCVKEALAEPSKKRSEHYSASKESRLQTSPWDVFSQLKAVENSSSARRSDHPSSRIAPLEGFGEVEVYDVPNGGSVLALAESLKSPARVRVTGDYRHPPVVQDYVLGGSILEGRSLARDVAKSSKQEIEQKLDRLGTETLEIVLAASELADLYPNAVRSLFTAVNQFVPPSPYGLCRYGLINRELPQILFNQPRMGFEISQGACPMYVMISERPIWQFSMCQLMVTNGMVGTARFYSRAGGYISFAIDEHHGAEEERGAIIETLVRTFVEDPESLSHRIFKFATNARLCLEDIPQGSPLRAEQFLGLIESYWEIFPRYGYSTNVLFPLLNYRQIAHQSGSTVLVKLPVDGEGGFRFLEIAVVKDGVQSCRLESATGSNGYPLIQIAIDGRFRRGDDHTHNTLPHRSVVDLMTLLARESDSDAVVSRCFEIFPPDSYLVEVTHPESFTPKFSRGTLTQTIANVFRRLLMFGDIQK